MKFKVKVMSTGRSGSNNGSNQKLCSCRFLSGGEKSGCGGVLAPRSLVTAGATPAATHCPHLGLVIPSRRGKSPTGSKVWEFKRQLQVKENASPLSN